MSDSGERNATAGPEPVPPPQTLTQLLVDALIELEKARRLIEQAKSLL